MTDAPPGPPYRIVTPRVVLRCWDPADTPALHELIAENLEHLRPWVSWVAGEPKPLEARLEEVRQWRAQFDVDQAWNWAMLAADDGQLVGGVVMNLLLDGASVDVGGWVGQTRARRGFHTDGAAAAARVAFEVLGMTRVQATTDLENERSIALMRKLGFTHEATLRHLENGERRDEMVWTILVTEWPATAAARIAAEAQAFDALGNRLF